MRYNAVPFLLAAALAFNGCSPSGSTPLYTISVNAEGLSLIDRNTPFEPRIIASRLPGFDVNTLSLVGGGREKNIIEADYGAATWFRFFADPTGTHIGSIDIMHSAVKTAPFAAIGTPFDQIYAKDAGDLCHNNKQNGTTLLCRSPESDTVFYRFRRDDSRVEALIWRSDAAPDTPD